MLTSTDIFQAILLPAIVSAAFAALALWRRKPWPFALGIAAGFVTAYGAIGRPGLPPADGPDWLYWLVLPVAALAVVDAFTRTRFGWLLGGLAAAGVTFVVLRPLPEATLSRGALGMIALATGGAAAATVLAVDLAARRMTSFWVTAALSVTVGAAGVAIMSSHARTIGVHGLALAAAIGPAAVFAFRLPAARSIAILAIPLLAGLLVSGRFYANLTPTNFWMLLLAPVLILAGAALPKRVAWLRGPVALLTVAVAAGCVAGPVALEAKRAAESDPYAAYRP